MKSWLSGKGIEAESLDKEAIKEMLSDAEENVADVLACRQQLAKASVSKYRAMQKAVCADGRAGECSRFTARIEPGAGPGALYNCKICPKTIWTIWRKPGILSEMGILRHWN